MRHTANIILLVFGSAVAGVLAAPAPANKASPGVKPSDGNILPIIFRGVAARQEAAVQVVARECAEPAEPPEPSEEERRKGAQRKPRPARPTNC